MISIQMVFKVHLQKTGLEFNEECLLGLKQANKNKKSGLPFVRCMTLDTNIEWRIIVDGQGTWGMGEVGQLRIIQSKYEQI